MEGAVVVARGHSTAVGERQIDADCASIASTSHQSEAGASAIFIDGVAIVVKGDVAGRIVVQNGQRRSGEGIKGCATGGIGQRQVDGFISFYVNVIDDGDGDHFASLAICEGEGLERVVVIARGDGTAIAQAHINADCSSTAPRPHQGDAGGAAILRDGVAIAVKGDRPWICRVYHPRTINRKEIGRSSFAVISIGSDRSRISAEGNRATKIIRRCPIVTGKLRRFYPGTISVQFIQVS